MRLTHCQKPRCRECSNAATGTCHTTVKNQRIIWDVCYGLWSISVCEILQVNFISINVRAAVHGQIFCVRIWRIPRIMVKYEAPLSAKCWLLVSKAMDVYHFSKTHLLKLFHLWITTHYQEICVTILYFQVFICPQPVCHTSKQPIKTHS
jgi:hypothetical protein